MIDYEWSPPYGVAVCLGLGFGLVVLLLLARRAARFPSARSWLLLLVRAGVLGLLVLLLLNPVQVSETRLPPRSPAVVFLIDSSRSMALDRPTSRLDQVKQVIGQSNQQLRSEQRPVISSYRFGQQLLACPDLETLRPDDDATRLLEALEQMPARFGEDRPGGVVVFSDGRTTETAGFAEVAAGYKRLGIPIHVYPVGDTHLIGDVAIEEVIAPRDAPAGSKVPIRVQVRSRGFQGQRAEVRIRSLTEPARKPLAALPITLADGIQMHELLIEQEAKTKQLLVEVPPLKGEAILENNQVVLQIGARKSKIRVIYMEGTLNNEYHWVHDALAEDRDIECVSMEVNNQYAVKPSLHRINDRRLGYPTTREELFSYDVVICSDINRTAFTQEQLDWTVELVGKRGGGFAMVGGNTSFGAGYWDRTVWEGLIPIDMTGQAQSPGRGTCWGFEFHVKVPAEVERHPIWRLVDDPVKNRQALDKMPPFTGSNLIARLKPAATPLGFSDRPLPRVGVMPIFACESFGKGRTFAMSTDTTADWGVHFESSWGENDNRYFRKFWRNVVRWLAENTGSGDRRLRLDTDKVIYHPGQPIQISARAFDDKLEETTRYRLMARLRTGVGQEKALQTATPLAQELKVSSEGKDHRYRGELLVPPMRLLAAAPNNPEGASRVVPLEVIAYDKDRVVGNATLDVQVLDDPTEYQDPRPDYTRLEELARVSDGKVLHSSQELVQLLAAFPHSPGELVVSRVPVWDHMGIWLLLLTLLTVEWVLRRSWGLA